MFGARNDMLLPAMLGLGILAEKGDICLANNTTMLLVIYLLLKHEEKIEFLIKEELREHTRGGRHGIQGIGGFGDEFHCFDPCDPCGCRAREREERRLAHRVAKDVNRELEPRLERIERCACHHRI